GDAPSSIFNPDRTGDDMIAALLPVLAPIVSKVVGNFFPDPQEKAKAEAEAMRQLLAAQSEIQAAASEIVRTEAASQHWLAANWRPLTMLIFVGLIVARWLGYSAPNISEGEVLILWEIVKVGLGGYVVGRSVEKVAPQIVAAIKK
ncbi:MAG: 3TM-type holin, partial [Phycisphaerae bacterium]